MTRRAIWVEAKRRVWIDWSEMLGDESRITSCLVVCRVTVSARFNLAPYRWLDLLPVDESVSTVQTDRCLRRTVGGRLWIDHSRCLFLTQSVVGSLRFKRIFVDCLIRMIANRWIYFLRIQSFYRKISIHTYLSEKNTTCIYIYPYNLLDLFFSIHTYYWKWHVILIPSFFFPFSGALKILPIKEALLAFFLAWPTNFPGLIYSIWYTPSPPI